MKKLVAFAFVAVFALPVVAEASKGAGFEIFQGGPQRLNQHTYFRLVAANGQTVLQSEAYTSEAAARKGILSIIRTGVLAATVALSKDRGYYFTLRGLNFKVTGVSEVYKSKYNAQRALLAIQALINKVRAKTLKEFAQQQ